MGVACFFACLNGHQIYLEQVSWIKNQLFEKVQHLSPSQHHSRSNFLYIFVSLKHWPAPNFGTNILHCVYFFHNNKWMQNCRNFSKKRPTTSLGLVWSGSEGYTHSSKAKPTIVKEKPALSTIFEEKICNFSNVRILLDYKKYKIHPVLVEPSSWGIPR